MSEKIKVAIAGINGRMGRAISKAILAAPEYQLLGGFGRPGADYTGKDICELIGQKPTGILVSNSLLEILARSTPDVLLDFTHAEIGFNAASMALEKGVRPVVGSSGLTAQMVKDLGELSAKKKIGAMVVPNFSIGAVLMMEFAKQAGVFYQNVEIVEMHHTEKLDAPSGTALHTAGKLASVGSNYNPKKVDEHESLPGARGGVHASGVRIHSLRLPGLISHQEVICGGPGELLTIRHDSFNTDCFLKGIFLSMRAVMSMDGLSIGLEGLLTQN